jgi:hypothetical protein
MSRSVLLVHPDVDELGALASQLRSRGLNVVIADGVDGAIERARRSKPDALLFSDALGESAELTRRFSLESALAGLPRFTVVDSDGATQLKPDQLPRRDVDAIAKRLYSLPVKAAPVAVDRGDFRGDVQQIGVIDLLQLLSMNRRTGALAITTPAGAGEVRLIEGEVVDAVYRRLEGEKALYRLLAELFGTFAFTSGSASHLRRVQTPTNVLLMEGMRQIDEVAQAKRRLNADQDAVLAVTAPPDNAPEVFQRIADMVTVPRTVDELLDDVPLLDLDILQALEQMLADGTVRRVWKGAVRVELAHPEQLAVIAAQVKRLSRAGFSGPPRLIITASQQRLSALMHSIGRIADALAPAQSTPAAPVPHVLATLRLGEGIELEVVGLPALDAYCPIWGLSLPGSMVVISVEAEASEPLVELCAVTGVPIVDSAELLGSVDEADPGQVAALIRMALECASGH